jgi:hypothetical protein
VANVSSHAIEDLVAERTNEIVRHASRQRGGGIQQRQRNIVQQLRRQLIALPSVHPESPGIGNENSMVAIDERHERRPLTPPHPADDLLIARLAGFRGAWSCGVRLRRPGVHVLAIS